MSDPKLKKAFETFDTDQSGTINQAELKHALEKAGFQPSIAECDWLIKKVDKNNNGEVDFDGNSYF